MTFGDSAKLSKNWAKTEQKLSKTWEKIEKKHKIVKCNCNSTRFLNRFSYKCKGQFTPTQSFLIFLALTRYLSFWRYTRCRAYLMKTTRIHSTWEKVLTLPSNFPKWSWWSIWNSDEIRELQPLMKSSHQHILHEDSI